MHKNTSVVVLTLVSLLSSSLIIVTADIPPFPGFPHAFWGTVKNQQGTSIPDGTIIKAVVDNETYYGTVMNGIYGFNETSYPSNPPFFVEDPDNNNEGKIIYFYIGGINTTQTAVFISGGDTYLDLIVPSGNGGGGGGNEPPGGGIPPNKAPPAAEADGPYFGTINRPIYFDGSKSNDSDGTIIRYVWDFGDINTSTGISSSHTYTKSGTYTVFLTVTDNDNLTDNDSAIVSITNDSDGDGWSDDEEARYKTNPNNSNDFPVDTDGDHIPNIIDLDDDNDGLTDLEEVKLGSNPTNETDVTKIIYQGITFFFVDINRDGQPDIYYNKTTGLNTTLQKRDELGTFSVDVNNDGAWEYIYNSQDGSISLFSGTQEEQTKDNRYVLYGFVAVIVVIVLLLLFIFKKRLRGNRK